LPKKLFVLSFFLKVLFTLKLTLYRNKIERAAEKHSCDMERHKLDMERQLAELRNKNLKKDLLELVLEQTKACKKFKFAN